ncbi:hypothetical protein [Streptomyces parvulus]|uniref:hypothetical protein n=2 Tax=Streptomyces parvulus TaxID=146923 RepID=UPI0033A44191
MPSMTAPLITSARPPLPQRPQPHERDGRQGPPGDGRPHPHTARAAEIGPRGVGAIYANQDGCFEVLALVTNPVQAARLLRRSSARWAVIVRDTLRPDGQPFVVGSVWTNEDYLIRPARTVYAPAA